VKEIILTVFGVAILGLACVGFYLELRFWRFHRPSFPERFLSYFVLFAILAISLVLIFARDIRTIARGYIVLMPLIVIGAVGVAVIRLFVVRGYIREARKQREALFKDIVRTLAKARKEEKPNDEQPVA
jgi:cytochrome oxidase assembly protein ShyY1